MGFSAWSQHHGPSLPLKQMFEKSWGYSNDLFACFVNLEKADDRVFWDKL